MLLLTPVKHTFKIEIIYLMCYLGDEKHGGKIWAESKGEGKGMTMLFTLLISSEKQEDREQQQN